MVLIQSKSTILSNRVFSHPSSIFSFARKHSIMYLRTPVSACLRPVTSRSLFSITSRSFLSVAAQSKPHMPSTSSTSINRLQQHQRHFTTTPSANMSESNQHFLLENVFSVKGKVALVTGGGSGIGLMATQALAVNGAKVYIVGRTQDKLDAAISAHGKDIAGQIIGITADISSKDEIARLVKEIESKEDHLDILINNAGISGNTQQTESKSAEEMKKNLFDDESSTLDDWNNTYRTNVPPLFFVSAAFLPMLAKATEKQYGWSGTIINITSISGIVQSSQHHFGYNASKAAAIHLTKMLAYEIATNEIKIRVNSIAPGVFPSEMTANESGPDQKSEIEKEKYAKVPAKRPGHDRDMAGAVLFAATNQYLNGQTVAVDGGYILSVGA